MQAQQRTASPPSTTGSPTRSPQSTLAGGSSGMMPTGVAFGNAMTRSSSASNGAATGHLLMNGSGTASPETTQATQVTLSMIIEFTPMQGSRLKRVVHESGALNKEERDWLTQYITKDLIQLQTLAMHIKLQEQAAAAAQRASAAMNNADSVGASPAGSPVGGINATPQRNSVRGSPSPQQPPLSNGGVGGNGAAAAAAGAGGMGSAKAETMSDDTSSFIKVISLEQLHTTVVVMFFALDPGGGEDGSAGGSSSGSGGFLSAAASGQAHMYAVAVALNDNNSIRLRLAIPSIRDWMFHSHQHIVALADVEYEADGNGDDDDDAAAGVVDVEQEWVEKLRDLKTLIDTWTNQGFITRNDIDLDATIFTSKTGWSPVTLYNILMAVMSHHRCILRSKSEREVQVWLNTLALFYSDDRLLFSSKTCFVPDPFLEPPISGGGGHTLSHHDVDDAVVITKGDMGGGGMSSSSLVAAAAARARQYIAAPDFNLQGTTAEVPQIVQHHLLHFRFAPVIIDVSKSLDEPYHFFPKDRQVKFAEVRERIFKRKIQLKPPFSSIFLHDKSRPANVRNSALLAGICGRLKLIAHPFTGPPHGATPPNSSPHTNNVSNASIASMRTMTPGGGVPPPAAAAVPGSGGGNGSGGAPQFLFTPRNSVDQMDGVAGGSGGHFPHFTYAALCAQHQTSDHQKITNILNAINQWRRQLVLRTLSYYYYTVEFRFKTDSQSSFSPAMFKEVADDAILQVAVDFFAQIQEQKEKHARNVLTEAFAW